MNWKLGAGAAAVVVTLLASVAPASAMVINETITQTDGVRTCDGTVNRISRIDAEWVWVRYRWDCNVWGTGDTLIVQALGPAGHTRDAVDRRLDGLHERGLVALKMSNRRNLEVKVTFFMTDLYDETMTFQMPW